MAEITAGLVKELREMTGLGMMECKKALAEAGGDLKKAEELLRIKSGAKASKAAARVAAEGVVGAYAVAGREARRDRRSQLRDRLRRQERGFPGVRAGRWPKLVANRNPADVAALSPDPGIEAQRQTLVQKIGENMSIRRFARLQAKGKLALAVRARRPRSACWSTTRARTTLGKDLAMHVAFAKPRLPGESGSAGRLVARERDILAARAKESGKPAEIVAKMVDGA